MDKENEESLHVFVVGNDDSILDFSSPLFKKVSSYTETLGRITIMCRTRKVVSELPILRGPLTIYAVHAGNPLVFLIRVFVLGRRIIKTDFSGTRVITADNPFEEGLAAWFLARLSRVPLQLQVHTDIMSPFFRSASWKEQIRYRLARFLITQADCIRVVSERIRRSLMSNIKCQMSNVFVLPIWTDISKFLNARPQHHIEERFRGYTFKMVAVGRFVDKEKNFSMLIDLMRDFVRVCPEALLVLVGDGPDRENYKLQITNYKLENHVILEKVSYDRLPAYLKVFDLFLLSSNYEGWGRVVVEAMASGLPVVMTDVGLAGEVVRDGENGLVVPVGDKEVFVSALKELLCDAAKRARLKNAAIKTILSASPKTREEYNLLYKESFYRCV